MSKQEILDSLKAKALALGLVEPFTFPKQSGALRPTGWTLEQLGQKAGEHAVAIFGRAHLGANANNAMKDVFTKAQPELWFSEDFSSQKSAINLGNIEGTTVWGEKDGVLVAAREAEIKGYSIDVDAATSEAKVSALRHVAKTQAQQAAKNKYKDDDSNSENKIRLEGAYAQYKMAATLAVDYLKLKGERFDNYGYDLSRYQEPFNYESFTRGFRHQLPDFHKNSLAEAYDDLQRAEGFKRAQKNPEKLAAWNEVELADRVTDAEETKLAMAIRLVESDPVMAAGIAEKMQGLQGKNAVLTVGAIHVDGVRAKLSEKGIKDVAEVRFVSVNDEKLHHNVFAVDGKKNSWVVTVYENDVKNPIMQKKIESDTADIKARIAAEGEKAAVAPVLPAQIVPQQAPTPPAR